MPILYRPHNFLLDLKEEKKHDEGKLIVELKKIAYNNDNEMDEGNLVIKEIRRDESNCVSSLEIYVTS